jgi:SAM-dependent methyltransferase
MLEEPPAQLVQVLDQLDVRGGAACDIGCGSGAITKYLAARIGTVVALDISEFAVREATRSSAPSKPRPMGLVAAAPHLPLRDGCMRFVLDRGCMHALPVALWAVHVGEIVRILEVGGHAHLIEHTLIPELLPDLLPPHAETVVAETFVFESGGGPSKSMTSAVLRRRW